MNILGERVKELRKEAGLTQIELGEKLGVDRNTIRRWENNENPPSEENLVLLSRCFDVSMYYLLGITDEKKMEMLTDEDEERIIAKRKQYDEERLLTLYRTLSPDMKKLIQAVVNNAVLIERDKENVTKTIYM